MSLSIGVASCRLLADKGTPALDADLAWWMVQGTPALNDRSCMCIDSVGYCCDTCRYTQAESHGNEVEKQNPHWKMEQAIARATAAAAEAAAEWMTMDMQIAL